MLYSLEVDNFGIIDHLEVEFSSGLNVLTGETGAGKSIILEALQAGLGQRAASEVVRSGAPYARVQIACALPETAEVQELLAGADIEPDEDRTLLLQREIKAGGRQVYKINGQAVTAQFYRQIGSQLVDLHGQHEQQALLQPARHSRILDLFAGEPLPEYLQELQSCTREWQQVQQKITDLQQRSAEAARQLDLLQYQIAEIDAASLMPGEEEQLQQERDRLLHAGRLAEAATRAYQYIYGGSRSGGAAVDALAAAIRELESVAVYDSAPGQWRDLLTGHLYTLEETAREIRKYSEQLESDPARLEEVQNRLDQIKKLQRKYGATVEQILDYRQRVEQERQELQSSEQLLEELQGRSRELEERWRQAAARVSGLRRQAAGRLEDLVSSELAGLEMAHVVFRVCFQEMAEISPAGREKAEFYLSPHPGEELRPLHRIASGGEMSRIFLVLKSVLAEALGVPTLVFDEIDAGIGGRTLQAVAEKIADLARYRQIICVTHAAAIAALADKHFYIFKQEKQGRLQTMVTVLDREQRVQELARMLGGRNTSPAVLEHARQMLKSKIS
ncbi:MAG: DNA repair protein RecN [Desulfurispora sp.]|uniref:DNA repair protein RecN n=1 Tax=Desulfurispora sp. TaxID=3014275 RepID=UPI00404AD5D1